MSKTKVLYIDDEPINIKLFDINFRNHCELHTAISGKEALELIKEIDFDVIVSDYKMPEMNGVEVINQSKTINNSAKYYLLSAYPEAEIRAITQGNDIIDGYISKPWNRDQIVELF